MPELQTVIVARARDTELSLYDLLHAMKLQGQLTSLIAAALVEKTVAVAAAKAGIRVVVDELQKAADRFRYRHGLTTTERTRNWLDQNGLTMEAWRSSWRTRCLSRSSRTTWSRPGWLSTLPPARIVTRGAATSVIVVATEDLARELLAQIVDEGGFCRRLPGPLAPSIPTCRR